MTKVIHSESEELAQPTIQPELVEKEKYLRLAADFQNYQRSIELQMTDLIKFSNQNTVQEILDCLDSLERALNGSPEAARADKDWWQGLLKVHEQFEKSLEKVGVKRIQTKSQLFDPSKMEVVATVEGGESQQVKEEIRAGYMMHERVIRPARVIVYS